MIRKKDTFLGVICLGIVGIILLAGLWPFDFWPENKVEFLKGENGIRFYGRGIVYSSGRLSTAQRSFPEVSIEIWLEPEEEIDHHLAHIFSLYDGLSSEDLIVGQWKFSLIVRSRSSGKNGRPEYKEIGLTNALPKRKSHLVTLVSSEKDTTIYLDGLKAKTFPRYTLRWDDIKDDYLVLGNSATGTYFWLGKLFGLSIYNRVLMPDQVYNHYHAWVEGSPHLLSKEEGLYVLYLFDEQKGTWVRNHADSRYDLLIPTKFQTLQKSVLAMPWKDVRWTRPYLKDIFLNVAGFVPLGFFTLLYLRLKNRSILFAALAVVVIGTALSLFVELLQEYLPLRTSSFMDLICNGLGTVLGAFLGVLVPKDQSTDSTLGH